VHRPSVSPRISWTLPENGTRFCQMCSDSVALRVRRKLVDGIRPVDDSLNLRIVIFHVARQVGDDLFHVG
jgi:hypothetical protein